MKAIKVTQINKRNFPNKAIGNIVPFGSVPKTWYYNDKLFSDFNVRVDLHEEAGFLPLNTNPSHDSKTQKINSSNILEVVENEIVVGYVYEVVDMTEAEISQRTLNEAEIQRQSRLADEQIKIVEEKFQEIETVEDILANEDVFPLWRNFEDGFNFSLNFKLRDFNAENELKVYKVIQLHNKQSDWFPRNVPALFVLVQEEGATEWEAGAQYIVGDIRTYQGIEYRCLQGHTSQVGWQPPNVPSLWTLN